MEASSAGHGQEAGLLCICMAWSQSCRRQYEEFESKHGRNGTNAETVLRAGSPANVNLR
jgi:hypothetical protein